MAQPLGLHVLDISRKVLAHLPSPSAQIQIPPQPSPSPSAQIQMSSLQSTPGQIQMPPLPSTSAQSSPSVQLQMPPLPSTSAQTQMGRPKKRPNETNIGVKSAIYLHDVGVKFRENEILLFDNTSGTLSLPPLTFDTPIEPHFLNAIAFECLHPATNNEVSSYIAFLRGLIDSPRDVEFLRSKEFIQSEIGDDQAVDRLMKTISQNVLFDPSSNLRVLRDDLNKYYQYNMGKWKRKPREYWRALRQTYFKNPWTIIAVIYALIILLLTALQTGYTVKQAK